MTKKEIKKAAKEIARLERILRTADGDEKYKAEMAIMTLTNKVEDIERVI